MRKGKSDDTFTMAHDAYLRRQAIQVAAMLPDSSEDAAAVLEYAVELLGSFLRRASARPVRRTAPQGQVIALKPTN